MRWANESSAVVFLVFCAIVHSSLALGGDDHDHKNHKSSGQEPGPGPHPGPGPRPGPGPQPGPGGDPHDPKMVCKHDFMRFCAFRVPDMDNFEQIIKCMSDHSADLCPECRLIVQNISDDINAFHAACDADLQSKCPSAIGEPMKTHECIIVNLADLSHDCLAEISTLAQKMEKHGGPHGPPPRGFMQAYPNLFGQFDVDPPQQAMYDMPMSFGEDRQG
eukprot:151758-Hanusia_phi.AAC.1